MEHRRAIPALLALGLAACGIEGSPADEVAALDEQSIKNGTVWNPWTQNTQTWTRNVVRLPGCTGTLLNREWVITAAYCFGTPPPSPAGITATLRLANGTDATSVGAELLYHPQVSSGVDVALLRLANPIDPGVASLPIYSGTTASLINKTVFCAGYGAIDTGAACQSSATCPGNQFCKWGVCMTPTDGQLRTASFKIIQDPDDAVIWYRFQVPNALGQLELPGDSGSTCWDGTGLTGIMKAGNATNYNRQTSAQAFRDWVNAVATPTVIKQGNLPGSACRRVGTNALTVGGEGEAWNPGAAASKFVCPVRRPGDGGFTDVLDVPRVFVVDRHGSQDVCCYAQSKNPDGTKVTTGTFCSTGASSSYQTLIIPSLYDPYTFSQSSLVCTVPPTAALGQSGVLGYRPRQAMR